MTLRVSQLFWDCNYDYNMKATVRLPNRLRFRDSFVLFLIECMRLAMYAVANMYNKLSLNCLCNAHCWPTIRCNKFVVHAMTTLLLILVLNLTRILSYYELAM